MSFWPFSSSFNNNSHLQKLLDSVVDLSKVGIDDLFKDRTIQQEFLEEVKTLSTKYGKKANHSIPSIPQYDSGNSRNSALAFNDDASVSSASNDAVGTTSSSKTAREAKMMELILQPHILLGLIDYISQSVEFYHGLAVKESEKLDELARKSDEHKLSDENPPDEVREQRMEDARDELEREEARDAEQSEELLRRCIQGATDFLSTEFWVISNRIIESPVLMDKLWSVISMPHLCESSPSVGYLVSILDHFLDSNTVEFLNFVRRQENLVDTFITKIEIPILMDFFIKIIQTDRADSPTGIIEVLSQQKLIDKLIDILKPSQVQVDDYVASDSYQHLFRQTAATELIKALISISSNSTLAMDLDSNIGPNQLTRELASPRIIKQMVRDIILYRIPGKTAADLPRTNKSGISNCVTILIELIRKNNSDYDLNCGTYSALLQTENGEPTGEVTVYVMYQWLKDFDQNPPGVRDPIFLGDMLQIFSDNMGAISELIDLDTNIPNAVNGGSETLGVTKFKIFELIAELLHCSNMILLNSKKIADIVRIRDEVRVLQESRLKDALAGSILNEDSPNANQISDVTSGIDDVSLLDMSPNSKRRKSSNGELLRSFSEKMEELNALEYVESDDEEPAVSQENPFVCRERDEFFRENPCIGDHFKIQLVDSNILQKMIKKFFQFPWHNFFHNVVFDLIQQIFNGKLNSYNSFLIVELFRKGDHNIISHIVETFQKKSDPRPGYTGHLILISEEVVKFSSLYKPGLISPVIVEAVNGKDWEWFVENVLLKTRELYNAILGADSEYDEGENMDGAVHRRHDDDSYGFDSSTVGYMDLEPYDEEQKNLIILGDSGNHEEFINSRPLGNEVEEDEDPAEDAKKNLSSVRIQNMSPSPESHAEFVSDLSGAKSQDHEEDLRENNFFDDLSGSSSDEENEEDRNELRRVPKHGENK